MSIRNNASHLILIAVCSLLITAETALAQQVVGKVQPANLELLKSAKLHEAFATSTVYHMDAPVPASKAPPAELIEVKPAIDSQLEKQAVWIPGYWEWDSAAERFTWTTGVWRFPPPGHRWVLGRWIRHEDGYVRVPGIWVPQKTQTLTYVSTPPKYKGNFPLPTAINDNEFWVPGCWVPATDGKFTWREPFVSRRVDKWEWVPAQYSWTPDGWLFVDGHWDYTLRARGQAFASLQLTDPAYEGDRIQLEAFAPVPMDAIRETDTGEFVYTVDEFPEKFAFVGIGTNDLQMPETPIAIERTFPELPTAVIRGFVHRGDLTPPRIEVELIGHPVIATTDDQGRFEFTNVPYGVYHLRAAGPVQNHVKRAYGRITVSEPVVQAKIELR